MVGIIQYSASLPRQEQTFLLAPEKESVMIVTNREPKISGGRGPVNGIT